MTQIETLIHNIINVNQAAVLAMIVNIEGSAYRKEGAWMLFTKGEAPLGTLSGGCLENDLHKRAEQLFHTGKTELISYDMSSEDDLGWGRGAGCNGVVHVLLRDLDQSFRTALVSAQQALQNKEPVLYIQSMDDLTQYTFTNKSSDSNGFWDDDSDSEWIGIHPFQKVVGERLFGTSRYFIQLIWPRIDLYILGAGIDARPLAKFAHDVGFGVHLLDWREHFCQKKYFPEALSVRHQNFTRLVDELTLSPLDVVVIMTHDFQHDAKILSRLKEKQLLYLGVLGTQKRTERLLGEKMPNNIRTPVGLSIGADGPEEIAISIVAELIAVIRGKQL